ncbi:MAG TPA: hypothetical protein VN577_23105 [Terriglobales bacterium]|nr:hypothetical protein [Terriglobales bacterium]
MIRSFSEANANFNDLNKVDPIILVEDCGNNLGHELFGFIFLAIIPD